MFNDFFFSIHVNIVGNMNRDRVRAAVHGHPAVGRLEAEAGGVNQGNDRHREHRVREVLAAAVGAGVETA
jgi:hypothetical protein